MYDATLFAIDKAERISTALSDLGLSRKICARNGSSR